MMGEGETGLAGVGSLDCESRVRVIVLVLVWSRVAEPRHKRPALRPCHPMSWMQVLRGCLFGLASISCLELVQVGKLLPWGLDCPSFLIPSSPDSRFLEPTFGVSLILRFLWCFLYLFLFALLYSLFPLKEREISAALIKPSIRSSRHTKTDPANQHTPPDRPIRSTAKVQRSTTRRLQFLLSLGRKFNKIDKQPRER